MHKLDTDQEGPVDIIFLKLTELITPALHATGHTPNVITTYSLLCGLAAAYFLWKGQLVAFVVLYLLAYLFDCVDGYMARRYKQMSVFGDYYDHISDIVKHVVLFSVIFFKYPLNKVLPIGLLLGILGLGMCIHFGCAQKSKYQKKPNSQGETLDTLQSLCFTEDTIQWAKYVSCGTFQLGIVAASIYLELSNKKKRRVYR
jgi:phosphatidylglycerophosphate synthase